MISKSISFVENFVLQLWWVLFFILLCGILYEQGIKARHQEFSKLRQHLTDLVMEKRIAKEKQDDLLLQINSQSDPGWVELLLMKGLGVVPEGHTKVYFSPRND